MGDAAAWPVAAAIRHFREEFEWHVTNPQEAQTRNYGLLKVTETFISEKKKRNKKISFLYLSLFIKFARCYMYSKCVFAYCIYVLISISLCKHFFWIGPSTEYKGHKFGR